MLIDLILFFTIMVEYNHFQSSQHKLHNNEVIKP